MAKLSDLLGGPFAALPEEDLQVGPPSPAPAPPTDGARAAAGLFWPDPVPRQVVSTAQPAVVPRQSALELPPGNLGNLVLWLERNARYQVREVALVTAIGITAGLCGRAYVTPTDAGLNVYLILVAKSAIGKDEMHKGAGRVLRMLRQRLPVVAELVRFNEYASGAALGKDCLAGHRSFVTFMNEFGKMLARMANTRDTNAQDVRTAMTKLYSKSGPDDVAPSLVYSKERFDAGGPVALSFVGDTTPSTLRTAMTLAMMEDGLLSRCGFVEYTGNRLDENAQAGTLPMPDMLAGWLIELASQSLTNLQNNRPPIRATFAEEAKTQFDAFERHCTSKVNTADDEAQRSLWGRARLKAMKYATLAAAADDHPRPIITEGHAKWGIGLVLRDVEMFEQSVARGDVGSDSEAQQTKLLHVLNEYLSKPLKASYDVPAAMQSKGLVPRRYLQMRTSDTATFKSHPLGSTRALDDALRSLCDSGYLLELDKNKVGADHGYQGRCYRIVKLK